MPSLGLVFLLVRIKHLLHISMVQWGFSDEGSVVRGLQQNGVLAGRGGGAPSPRVRNETHQIKPQVTLRKKREVDYVPRTALGRRQAGNPSL